MTALTATAIVTAGYRDAQKLARLAPLAADQLSEGIDRLNDLINLWQTQGLKLFLELEKVVTLISGQQTYAFMPGGDVNMPRPLQVKDASYWGPSGSSYTLTPISRSDWSGLSMRTQTGAVTQFFAEKLYDRLNLNLWLAPDANAALGTLHVVVRQQASNVSLAADPVLFPPEWAIALRWALADELCFGMPEPIQMRCQTRAQAYREALEAWDVEDVETTFVPDDRNFTGGKFR